MELLENTALANTALAVKSLTRRHRGTEVGAKFVKRAVHFAAFALAAMLLFAGCQTEPEDNSIGSLHGVWYFNSGSYEGIVIIDIADKTIKYENTYEAEIINFPDFKSSNGVIILQFTSYKKWTETTPGNWELSDDQNSIGKFGALYWRNLKANSVNMSDAYSGFDHALFNTKSEAETNFTLDKAGNYIQVWGGPFYK